MKRFGRPACALGANRNQKICTSLRSGARSVAYANTAKFDLVWRILQVLNMLFNTRDTEPFFCKRCMVIVALTAKGQGIRGPKEPNQNDMAELPADTELLTVSPQRNQLLFPFFKSSAA